MKKTVGITFVILLCLLAGSVLAGCGNNAPESAAPAAESTAESVPESSAEHLPDSSSEAPQSEPEGASDVEVGSVEPVAEPTPTPEVVPDPAVSDAEWSLAYLEQIRSMKDPIMAYDWQTVASQYSEEDDPDKTALLKEPSPIALSDLDGNGVPELLVLAASEDGSEANYLAYLSVFEYDNGAAVLVYRDRVDALAGGGWNYFLFRTEGSPNLYCFDSYGDEYLENVFSVFEKEDGLYVKKEVLRKSIGYEGGNETVDCLIEGGVSDEEPYLEREKALIDSIEDPIVWNAIYEEGLVGKAKEFGHSALSYKDAEKYLSKKAGEENAAYPAYGFGDIIPENGLNFFFASGAGGWSTDMTLFPDGSFTGSYHDSEMGDSRAENGVVYTCEFSGYMDNLKVEDYNTFSMNVVQITMDYEPETSWEEDGVLYITTEPYGLSVDAEITMYDPGHATADIPEGFMVWARSPRGWSDSDIPAYLPFYGLYNVTDDCGFTTADVVYEE